MPNSANKEGEITYDSTTTIRNTSELFVDHMIVIVASNVSSKLGRPRVMRLKKAPTFLIEELLRGLGDAAAKQDKRDH
jgi:hypothetical protein